MTPRFHDNGTHFKGLARYLLHDIDADSSGRVEHTETRNLSTDNPEAAWRVMAAVSMNQDRLKRAAGIRPGGRQSKEHCGHISISWSPEEGTNVTREEMVRSADFLMKEIKAQDYQALYVIHNDTEHKHIHIMWNRVSVEDGRILSLSWNKRKASRLSQKYEEQRVREGKADKIYCPQRVINNKLRDRGHYVKYDGWQSRDQYEKSKVVAEQDAKWQKIEQQRKQMAELKQRQRDQRLRHAQQQAKLLQKNKKLREELIASRSQMLIDAKHQAISRFQPEWEHLLREQDAELSLFNKQEQTLRGRLLNAFERIDFRSVFGRGSASDDGRITTVSEIFELNDRGKRLEILKRQHEIQEAQLRLRQRRAEIAADEATKSGYRDKMANLERQAQQEINDLNMAQQIERSKEQIAISQIGKQQRVEMGLPKVLRKTVSVANPSRYRMPANDESAAYPTPTRAADLLPREGSEMAAYKIRSEQERHQCVEDAFNKKQDKDRDHGDQER